MKNLKLGHGGSGLDTKENISFQLLSSRLNEESGCGETRVSRIAPQKSQMWRMIMILSHSTFLVEPSLYQTLRLSSSSSSSFFLFLFNELINVPTVYELFIGYLNWLFVVQQTSIWKYTHSSCHLKKQSYMTSSNKGKFHGR